VTSGMSVTDDSGTVIGMIVPARRTTAVRQLLAQRGQRRGDINNDLYIKSATSPFRDNADMTDGAKITWHRDIYYMR